MPLFVTTGYGDRQGYDRTAEQVREAAHAHDRRLQSQGTTTGVAGSPVQVRHDGAGTTTESGPCLRAPLPVAGSALLEAADLAEAVRLVSGTPCAVAHGVVEVWPLQRAEEPGCPAYRTTSRAARRPGGPAAVADPEGRLPRPRGGDTRCVATATAHERSRRGRWARADGRVRRPARRPGHRLSDRRGRGPVPLWFALAPVLVVIAAVERLTSDREGLLPSWVDVVVLVVGLVLAALPFAQRVAAKRRR